MSYFPYNTGVPAAQNNPSNDQSPMQTNNLSIYELIAINHVPFEEDTGGYHTTLTFDQTGGGSAYVPVPPVDPPQLFTNIVDGVGTLLSNPELFFYSGSEEASQNQYVSKNPGSVLLFGGIIIKWGIGTGSTPTFVKPFPNNCFSVVTTGINSASSIVTSVTVNGFTTAVGAGATYYYIAIGN